MTVAELWQGLTSVVGQIAAYSTIAAGAAFALFRFLRQAINTESLRFHPATANEFGTSPLQQPVSPILLASE